MRVSAVPHRNKGWGEDLVSDVSRVRDAEMRVVFEEMIVLFWMNFRSWMIIVMITIQTDERCHAGILGEWEFSKRMTGTPLIPNAQNLGVVSCAEFPIP